MNYAKLALTAKRLIDASGRDIKLFKLDATAANALKPWRGPGVQTPTDEVDTRAVFAIGNTSIPTKSRGLAFDWVDQDLLKVTRHVCIVAAEGLPDLTDYKIIQDGSLKNWNILWGQCLQPGVERLLYVFGIKE